MNEAAPRARARLEVIQRIESLLRRLPPWLVMGSCWLLLALVAWADHMGGLDLHLEAFYLLPVFGGVARGGDGRVLRHGTTFGSWWHGSAAA